MTDATSITTGTLIAGQKIKGTTVYNLAGEKLGTVDDIMIDKASGRAIYAVMSFGGFLGMGEKSFAIPWSAFTVQLFENDLRIVLNVDKEILKKAQGFDKSQLPLGYSQLDSVYTYYGYKPYWQTGD